MTVINDTAMRWLAILRSRKRSAIARCCRPTSRSPASRDCRRSGHRTDGRTVIFAAIAADLDRPTFRGCAFNNASIEFPDPQHPARAAARGYREQLHQRLVTLAGRIHPARGDALGDQLALVIDGMYTSAAHLGPRGPAAAGPALANALIRTADV